MKLVLVSRNEGKLAELRALLAPSGAQLVGLADIGFDDEIDETGSTFLENALIKAHAVADVAGIAAIADDSGLCVDALCGDPGVYSARYGGDACKTDTERTALLLCRLEGADDRRAHFACAIACVLPDGTEITAEGRCDGVITHSPRGEGGFGYDPVFEVDGKTFAEMSEDEKNTVSHRARALAAFAGKLI